MLFDELGDKHRGRIRRDLYRIIFLNELVSDFGDTYTGRSWIEHCWWRAVLRFCKVRASQITSPEWP